MVGPYEIIVCPQCEHEQKPRPRAAEGKWIVPCGFCGNEDVEVYDLVLVPRDPDVCYVPTAAALEHYAELERVQ
jgi:hypothetical protein